MGQFNSQQRYILWRAYREVYCLSPDTWVPPKAWLSYYGNTHSGTTPLTELWERGRQPYMAQGRVPMTDWYPEFGIKCIPRGITRTTTFTPPDPLPLRGDRMEQEGRDGSWWKWKPRMVDAFPVNWVMRRRIVPGSGSWRVIKLPIITSANLHVLFKLLRTPYIIHMLPI